MARGLNKCLRPVLVCSQRMIFQVYGYSVHIHVEYSGGVGMSGRNQTTFQKLGHAGAEACKLSDEMNRNVEGMDTVKAELAAGVSLPWYTSQQV